MINFIIPGEPKAKARPRFGNGHTYTPETTVNYENYVKMCFMQSKNEMLDGQLEAEITCLFKLPKGLKKESKQYALTGRLLPTKRPDVDNLAKSILDSLNGLAYKDDSQIVKLTIEKRYSETPITIVTIKEYTDF